MSSNLKKANHDLLEDFIGAYESQSCLWRIKSKDYYDKTKKDAAHVNRSQRRQEINAFKTNYRREKKKVESHHSGSGIDEIYVPTFWYYLNISGRQSSFRSREIAVLLVISHVV
jgi:hypothetical protein